jgi:hypothetical protein
MTVRDDRLLTDTTRGRGARAAPPRSGVGGFMFFLLLLIIAAVVAAFAFGLVRINSIGSLQPPHVAIEGGQVPKIELNTARIDMHSKTVTIDVPEVTVEKPADLPPKQ